MGARRKVSDEQILAALEEHGSVARAAHALGVTDKAIYQRLDTDGLRGRWRRRRYRQLETELEQVLERVPEALRTLEELAVESGPRDSVRLAAANQILQLAMRLREKSGAASEQDTTWQSPPRFEPRLVGTDDE